VPEGWGGFAKKNLTNVFFIITRHITHILIKNGRVFAYRHKTKNIQTQTTFSLQNITNPLTKGCHKMDNYSYTILEGCGLWYFWEDKSI